MHRPLAVPSLKEPTLKADPSAQLKLLDVQELDARADQLRHQRSHLPELAEIAELQQQRAALDDRVRDARILVDDLTVEQTKVDADVEQVKTRRTRDRDRMDQGLITNPKDLERMQQELVSLERRITTLEDEELEVMERLEAAQMELDRATSELAETDAPVSPSWRGSRDDKLAALDEELAERRGRARPDRRGAAGRPGGPLRPAARAEGRRGCRGAARPRVRRLSAHRRQRRDRGDPGRGRRRGRPLRGVPADPGAHARVRAVITSRDAAALAIAGPE